MRRRHPSAVKSFWGSFSLDLTGFSDGFGCVSLRNAFLNMVHHLKVHYSIYFNPLSTIFFARRLKFIKKQDMQDAFLGLQGIPAISANLRLNTMQTGRFL
jgi:hypothetical protein